MTLIDTAEMYASGGAEEVVAEALAGRRDEAFLVSKVLPANASEAGVRMACEASLRRLGTDRIDLYLLHWAGSHPLAGTVAAFEALRREGKIVHWGVSNFDVKEMEALERLAPGGAACNQVLYNLQRRGIEHDLLPWCVERGILLQAYSPLDQGRIKKAPALRSVARRHGITPEQVALAWSVRLPGVQAIPKAAASRHVESNAAAARIELAAADLAELDAAFPRPRGPTPLEML
jgi:diketogulonate reductase-like aldo/keto reductase